MAEELKLLQIVVEGVETEEPARYFDAAMPPYLPRDGTTADPCLLRSFVCSLRQKRRKDRVSPWPYDAGTVRYRARGYWHRVKFIFGREVLARHERSYARESALNNPKPTRAGLWIGA
jgi:hypothetical protein